jgi:hypothetical protein
VGDDRINRRQAPGVGRLPDGARVCFSVGQEVLDSQRDQDRTRFPVCIFNRDFIHANLQQEDYTQAPTLFIVDEGVIRLSNRISLRAFRPIVIVSSHSLIEIRLTLLLFR